MATPITPLIGGINLAYHDSAGTFYRVRGHPEGLGDDLDSDYFDFNMNVNTIIWGRNPSGDYDRMRSEGASGSYAFRTSTWVETEDGFFTFLINSEIFLYSGVLAHSVFVFQHHIAPPGQSPR